MRVLFIINPISGGKDKRNFVKNINNYCFTYGIDYRYYYTNGKFDIELIQDEIKSFLPDRIISVGGDGTFRMLCTAAKGLNIPVGYIPFGSANGLNKDLLSGDSPWECFESLMTTYYTKMLDIIEINGKDCVHVADVGVNAQLVKAFDADKNRGMFTYAKYFFKALDAQETYKFEITVDGQTYEKKGCMFMIANGTRYGSGIMFNKEGTPFDGKFEIIILKKINLFTLLKAGFQNFDYEARTGNYYNFTASEVDVKISRETTLQVDGEVAGRFDFLKIKMSDKKIPVLLVRQGEENLMENFYDNA